MTDKSKADRVFFAVAPQLDMLEQRWQDESEYEDFADYIESARRALAKAGATLQQLTKYPFTCVFYIDSPKALYRITSSAKQLKMRGPLYT